MKQGRAPTVVSGRKVEPMAKAMDPGAVSNIGVQQFKTKPQPLHAGRGFNAPAPVSQKTHKGGSQGRH